MRKKYDVTALGELLIDFSPGGISETGSDLYECNPGGAPANVLTAVARQGGRAAFIGKVGEDAFGRMLEKVLKKNNICTDGLRFDKKYRTTLAFVSLDEEGNRAFSFFRNPGADYLLTRAEVDTNLITESRIFHFGSLSLTNEPARDATDFALETARENGLIISFDPNLRLLLWESAKHAREQIVSFLKYADIVKLSDEEFTFITGETDYRGMADAFTREYGISHLFITLGSKGAFYYVSGISGILPAYNVQTVDTTGSGDAFMGAVLARIARMDDYKNMDKKTLDEIVAFANASGSLTSSIKGAIPAIPTEEQIMECIKSIPVLE